MRKTAVVPIAIIAALIVATIVLWPRVTEWLTREEWRAASPGIELRTCTYPGVFGAVTVTAARLDPRCSIRVADMHQGIAGGGAQASDVCPAGGVAINANFFDESLNPIGLVIADGATTSKLTFPQSKLKPWGLFLHDGAAARVTTLTARYPQATTQAVQCGPMLVTGSALNTFPALPSATRAGVGVDARGRVIFAISEGSFSMAQWAACMKDKLGCVNALNLDGGPSAQLAVKGARRSFTHDGSIVPVFLVAEPLP